jgi:hypothetical protein
MNRSFFSEQINFVRSGGLQLRPTDPVSLFGGVTFALFLALLLSCATRVSAQVPTGTIVGTVQDAQGLPVEGATVTLTNQGTNSHLTAEAKGNGEYQFRSIDAGLYSITVSMAGFKGSVLSNIKLDASTEYTVQPIRLEIGSQTESITVEAGAENIQSSSAEVTGTVLKQQIEELPILDRNPLNLLSLQAGVSNSGPGGQAETVINGQRSSFSNLTLDGINIQDNFIRENALDFSPNLPFLSQVQEFTITQQNGDVDKNGSSSVSLVTPKGTNKWHGEGFWYYRTNAWKANDWFNAASGTPTPGLLQNQGGGDIGGPIKKDKLFIYGYYELLRLHAQTPINSTILSPSIQTALASGTLPFKYQPVDQNTGLPVGPVLTANLLTTETTNNHRGCVVPSCQPAQPPATVFTIDPAMLKLIQRLPTASNNTRVGDSINLLGYQFNSRNNNTRDNYGFRADYNLNAHNSFSGTFSYNRNVVDRPDIDVTFDKVPLVSNNDHEKFLSTSWRWNPNSNFTNEVRFGFNLAPGFFITQQSFSSGTTIDSVNFPFTGPDPNFLPQGRNTRTWAYQDNASLVRGNHVIKFGVQMQRVTIAETNSAGIYPDLVTGFGANNVQTPVTNDFPAPNGATISQADFNNASNLLAAAAGALNNVNQTFNVKTQTSGYVPLLPFVRNLRQNNWALYLGDNWRVTSRLTFNYGVRWEYFSPVDERNGLEFLPVQQPGQTIEQTLLSDAHVDFAGGPSKRGLYKSAYKQFAPNIGVAWDPFGNGKTAIRAGFSMNYVNDSFFTAAENATTGNSGLSTAAAADTTGNGLPAGFTVSNPATVPAPAFVAPPNVTFSSNAAALGVANNVGYAIDPNLKAPYVEQWNLSVQRQIGANNSVTVAYIGNHGVGLFRAIDVNQVIIGPNGFLAGFNQARAQGFASLAANGTFDPSFGGIPAVFQNICGPGANGLIDQSISVINTDIQQGFVADLATLYRTNACSPSANFFAPNELILGGDLLKNTSFSSYNAGVVEFRRRLSTGFYLQANYTYSKVLTDFGTSVNGDQARFQPFLDNARPRLSKGRAPFDLTHVFKANFTYELPIGKGHRISSERRAFKLLLDGWRTGSIFTWQSGTPFSIVSRQPTFNRAGTRSAQNTAVSTLTPGQIKSDLGVFVQPGGIVYLINPKLVSANGTGAPASNGLTCAPAPLVFCNPQPGEVGNLQLYAFSAPSYFDWDLSAAKTLHITERFGLTFRTDAFNVLNHPVFAPPFDANGIAVMNINDQKFGQSRSTISAPRILQMSLRLNF